MSRQTEGIVKAPALITRLKFWTLHSNVTRDTHQQTTVSRLSSVLRGLTFFVGVLSVVLLG